jgi:hypothetical protein
MDKLQVEVGNFYTSFKGKSGVETMSVSGGNIYGYE